MCSLGRLGRRRGASVGGAHAYGSPSAGARTTEVRRRSSSALGFNTGKSLAFASSDADDVTPANESRDVTKVRIDMKHIFG